MTVKGGWKLSSSDVDGEREATTRACAPATARTGTRAGMAWLPCTRVLTTSNGNVAIHPALREHRIIADSVTSREVNLPTPATPPANNSAGHESVVISVSTWTNTFDPLEEL